MDGEDVVQGVLRDRLSEGDFFVDVGANFGLHTMYASHLVGEKGRIVAIEPVPANLELLRRNLDLNDLYRSCKVFPNALNSSGSGDVEMMIETGLSPAATLAGTKKGRKITVKASTLDACLAGRARTPDLIKIDVEGAEHEVLKGAIDTLEKGAPLLIEVHTFALPAFKSSPEALRDFLAEFGYRETRLTTMESEQGEYFHALYLKP
ncbi:MAG: FkbM family methyltransferase [Verrucomicrobiaceae bacterium]